MRNANLVSELNGARLRFVGLLTGALDLQIRLLHSTEIDPRVIAREHDTFTRFLDKLSAHPQQPHIRHFSSWNEEEFVRAELDHLRLFSDELQTRRTVVREILALPPDEKRAIRPIEELIEGMIETGRAGWPNQFTSAQRATLLRIADPRQYYGSEIGRKVFGTDDASFHPDQGESVTAERSASHDPASEIDLSLVRMKAQVIADRLGEYAVSGGKVLATALLKIKHWMSKPQTERLITARPNVPGLSTVRLPGPAIEVLSANPRDLLLVFHSENGSRAVVHVGISNGALHGFAGRSELPLLTTPGVSLLLFSAGGDLSGSAYVVTRSSRTDPTESLALLIKRLDFAQEFMQLTETSGVNDRNDSTASEEDDQLLAMAEAL